MDDSVNDLERKDDMNNDEQNVDIDFVYNDADEYNAEIAELYSYSEEPEFLLNKQSFEEDFYQYVSTKWFETNSTDQHAHVLRLLDRLDSGKRDVRQKAVRAILYLLQGNFGDCELEEDQIIWARRNVYMFIEAGLLSAMIQVLLYEIECDTWPHVHQSSNMAKENQMGASDKDPSVVTSHLDDSDFNQRNKSTTLVNNADLRAILSILYIMVETVRDGLASETTQLSATPAASNIITDPTVKLREQFCEELASPILSDDETTLTVVLLDMVNRFCNGCSHFPIKKVLLLLWKVLLLTLGPITTMFSRKNAARARWNLPPLFEDTHQVIRRIRANSPPGSSADQAPSRPPRPPRANSRHVPFDSNNQPPKQGSLAKGRPCLKSEAQSQPSVVTSTSCSPSSSFHSPSETPGFATPRPGSPVLGSTNNSLDGSRSGANTPLPFADSRVTNPPSMQPVSGLPTLTSDYKMLPWKPKVRKKDLENFLTNVRLKFVKFQVPNDTTSLIGLPEPIHEAVRVLREHLYTSLSEVQIQREQDFTRNPISMGREIIPDTPVERLYRAVYPSLPQYMVALLRVLLAAAPTSRAKTEPINILAEVMPEDTSMNPVQTTILNSDINRHRELIVKAISALLLLLLKHLKLNHVYQFEYVSQYLVFANCIPLILKFFNQNISHYVYAKNSISFLEFPSRFIGKTSELTPEMLVSDWTSYCWRNLFACINLLRILNMLTKWKHSRTMLLVVFKSAPILKRALRVRHAMMQLYALKLLKLQSRYFGRQWRKNNMPIMSAIYQKVRHRLTDDWAYGNDVDAVPWRFQLEEHTLRVNVEHFNQRRYTDSWLDPDFKPLDNCLTSVLNQPYELSDEFKRNYEKWLEEEVFSVPINWSQLLAQ